MKRVFIVLALLCLSAVMVIAQSGGSIEVIGGDEDDLRNAVRFLVGDGRPGDITLTLGELPDDLPITPPEIDGVELVGVMDQREFGSTEVWLLSEMTPGEVVDAYSQALTAEGWTAIEEPYGSPGGFVVNERSGRIYCPADDMEEVIVNLSAFRRPDATTSIRFNIASANGEYMPPFCDEDFDMNESFGRDPYRLLPELRMPDSVEVVPGSQSSGGGGSPANTSVLSSVVVETDLDAVSVAPLFEEQLMAAGWEQTGGEMNADYAWSSWTFEDEDGDSWNGLFAVNTLGADSNQFYTYVRISNAQGEE